MTVTLTGAEEIGRAIERLKTSADRKGARKAINKAINIIAKAYRDAAPNGPPKSNPNHLKMKKAVRRKVRIGSRNRPPTGKVGFDVGKKRGDKTRSYHSHLVSVGTVMRRTRTGANRGRVKPSSKIGNHVTAMMPRAVDAMFIEMFREIDAEWKR